MKEQKKEASDAKPATAVPVSPVAVADLVEVAAPLTSMDQVEATGLVVAVPVAPLAGVVEIVPAPTAAMAAPMGGGRRVYLAARAHAGSEEMVTRTANELMKAGNLVFSAIAHGTDLGMNEAEKWEAWNPLDASLIRFWAQEVHIVFTGTNLAALPELSLAAELKLTAVLHFE